MANIQSWELLRYQYAAEQMCQRLGESPHELVQQVAIESDGQHRPRWFFYAIRMHEHAVMVELMRQSGIPV